MGSGEEMLVVRLTKWEAAGGWGPVKGPGWTEVWGVEPSGWSGSRLGASPSVLDTDASAAVVEGGRDPDPHSALAASNRPRAFRLSFGILADVPPRYLRPSYAAAPHLPSRG